MGADELGFEGGLAVFQPHLEHFPEVVVQLFQGFALGMRTGKAGDIAHVELGFQASFNDGSKRIHALPQANRVGYCDAVAYRAGICCGPEW